MLFKDLLQSHKQIIDLKLKELCERLQPNSVLKDACAYSLKSNGKRLRPILVLLIAACLKPSKEIYPAALSVELFHTASLIADDLPCMDNDDYRRDAPSLHKAFSENIALLASYALIGEGYTQIIKSINELAENQIFDEAYIQKIGILVLEFVAKKTGINGAPTGQYYDMFSENPSPERIDEIIYFKTITLFEIAFVIGWLLGGGEQNKLNQVCKAAYHFGYAFQVADDILDLQEDNKRKLEANYASFFGEKAAFNRFKKEIQELEKELSLLGLLSKEMLGILDLVKAGVIKIPLTQKS